MLRQGRPGCRCAYRRRTSGSPSTNRRHPFGAVVVVAPPMRCHIRGTGPLGTSAARTDIRWPGLTMELAVDGLLVDCPLYPACRDGYAGVDDLEVTDRNICVWRRDGRTLTVPLGWFLRLADGSPAKRD